MLTAGLAAEQLSCQTPHDSRGVVGTLTYQAEVATLTISGTRVMGSACMPCRVAFLWYRNALNAGECNLCVCVMI